MIQGRNGFWKITPDPVDPGSHVLSIFLKAEIDTGTANRPQVILRANSAVGVQSDIILTAAAGTDWQEIVIAFTPTAKGRIRGTVGLTIVVSILAVIAHH